MPTKSRVRPRPPATTKPPRAFLAEGLPKLERRWFELDRTLVVDQLLALRTTLTNGATQMDMVAAERMFEEPLTKAILCEAKALQQLARKLGKLADRVAFAPGYPKIRR
jgi:hypothetical protein